MTNISGDTQLVDSYEAEKHTNIAIKLLNSGNYEKGMDFIEKALNINKTYGKAQYIMGFIFEFYKEDFKKAVKWYTAAHINGYDKAETSLYRVIRKISSFDISYNKKND